MYGTPFVPATFAVPARSDSDGYHLRMLTIEDLDKDFEAVTVSAEKLQGLFGPASDWPAGVTKREDLIDLAWHEREFTLRRSFAYTVLTPDEQTCLGCVYIFPTEKVSFDAAIFYWARQGLPDDFELRLGQHVRAWLKSDWPFQRVAFPGRDIEWAAWDALPSIRA